MIKVATAAIGFAFFGCFLPFSSSRAEDGSGQLVTERFMLPAQFKNAEGSVVTINLDTLVIRPNDDLRHPLAILNHGTDSANYKHIYAEHLRREVLEFARRGWVAVAFTRRGFGHSEGGYSEGLKGCEVSSYVQGGLAAAEDVREVIRLMGEKPYVDAAKVISVGHSGGGYATIALTANPPPGLVAGINFAGGNAYHDDARRDCSEDGLAAAAATFGKTSRVPTLWVYSENDRVIPESVGRRMYEGFTQAGGDAEFITGPAQDYDGHHLFTSRMGLATWTHYVDDFLDKHGLKLTVSLADIEDGVGVEFPSALFSKGRSNLKVQDAYLDYLDGGDHKAFAVSTRGGFGYSMGRASKEKAVEEATAICRGVNATCTVISVDGEAP